MSEPASEGSPLQPQSHHRDLVSAYVATGAKIGSWALVSAVVFRFMGAGPFAVLALVRGTIGLLNYVTLGLAPAMVRNASLAASSPRAVLPDSAEPDSLSYFSATPVDQRLKVIYTNGLFISLSALFVGTTAAGVVSGFFQDFFRLPQIVNKGEVETVVYGMALGTLFRLVGDAPGAVLQVRGKIATDNLAIATGDLVWVVATVACCLFPNYCDLTWVAKSYGASGILAASIRFLLAGGETRVFYPSPALFSRPVVKALLGYGSLVVLGQLADYLYAPTDYILIDRLLDPKEIANYAPAIQIDAALLVLVSGLASVMLPWAAIAHARQDAAAVKRYYVRGTLASLGMLAIASSVTYGLSPILFKLWLGDSMPETRRILPLLLICTTLGGSSAVGRSILLAVGKVKPFTTAVLIAGVTNVVFSFVFVRVFHWGLAGVVMGTVVAVVGRCVVWMPWYVMRVLRNSDGAGDCSAIVA